MNGHECVVCLCVWHRCTRAHLHMHGYRVQLAWRAPYVNIIHFSTALITHSDSDHTRNTTAQKCKRQQQQTKNARARGLRRSFTIAVSPVPTLPLNRPTNAGGFVIQMNYNTPTRCRQRWCQPVWGWAPSCETNTAKCIQPTDRFVCRPATGAVGCIA